MGTVGNGGVERINHTMAQVLEMVVDELHNNWEEQLPNIEIAYNNSVSAATGLARNEVRMGRLSRLLLAVFECAGVAGHQILARDQLAYCELATDHQQRAYDIVRKHHALTAARVNRRNRRPRRSASSSPQIRRWRLGVGVQYGGHHLPGRET